VLSALLWLTFDAGFASGDNRAARVGFVLAVITAAWTQYYLTFVAVALVAGLIRGDARRLRAAVVALACAGVGILPLLPIARSEITAHASPTSLLFGLKAALDPTVDFLLPYGFAGHGALAHVGYGLVLLTAVVLVVVGKPVWTPRLRAGVVGLATLVVLYTAVIFVTHVIFSVPRHAAGMLSITFAFAIALFAALRSPHRGAIRALLAVLFTVCSLATLIGNYHTGAKIGDWRRVGNYLDAHTLPGDVVAVFDPESELPLRRYFHEPRRIVPLPQPLGTTWSTTRFGFRSETQARRLISARALGEAHVWLVVDETCDVDRVLFGCDYLEDAVRANFRTLSTTTFFGSSVRELVARRAN